MFVNGFEGRPRKGRGIAEGDIWECFRVGQRKTSERVDICVFRSSTMNDLKCTELAQPDSPTCKPASLSL